MKRLAPRSQSLQKRWHSQQTNKQTKPFLSLFSSGINKKKKEKRTKHGHGRRKSLAFIANQNILSMGCTRPALSYVVMRDLISSLDSGIQVLASKSGPQHLLLCDPGRYFTSLCPSHHICKIDILTLASSSLGRSEDYLSLFICVKHIGARLAQNKCLGSKM